MAGSIDLRWAGHQKETGRGELRGPPFREPISWLEGAIMDVALPLDKMTTAEKLRVLEEVWSDLCRTPEDIPAPAWHADVLEARAKRVQEGSAHYGEWTEAKRRIREQTR